MLTLRTGQVVGRRAAILVAEVLTYAAAEIVELAGNAAKELGALIVSPRHITLAIRGDEELDALIPGLIIGGGVIPYVRSPLGISMDDLLSSSAEEKQKAHKEFVIFNDDSGEVRSLAPQLHHTEFHGEGKAPTDLELSDPRAANAGDGREQAANGITKHFLRLIAVRS
jgi:hypothetical protein